MSTKNAEERLIASQRGHRPRGSKPPAHRVWRQMQQWYRAVGEPEMAERLEDDERRFYAAHQRQEENR